MSIKNLIQISLLRKPDCRLAVRFFGSWSKYVKIFLYVIIIQINTSCSTLPAVSADDGLPSVFLNIESISPLWRHFADGVGFFHGRIETPSLEFWALKIDLSAENITVVTGSGGITSAENAVSVKVSGFVRENNLIAGINAVPFDIITAREGEPIRNMGIIISDGVRLSPANPYYDALVFYRAPQSDNEKPGESLEYTRAAIVRQSSIQSGENIENAVGGFYQILTDGEPAQRTLTGNARHPRSAAGVSDNGGHLYFLVIDGRRTGSIGSTEYETAVIMRKLGCRDVINFDGGGSSALALRFQDGSVRAVNTPVHFFTGQERAVAGCIGIRIE